MIASLRVWHDLSCEEYVRRLVFRSGRAAEGGDTQAETMPPALRNAFKPLPPTQQRPIRLRVESIFRRASTSRQQVPEEHRVQVGGEIIAIASPSIHTVPHKTSLKSHLLAVTSWTDSHCKLVVQLPEAEDGAVSGHPTGPVWVVNYTGYDKAEARRRASTKLEGMLVARVADSLPELLSCRRALWPKFEDMDVDYVEFHPFYQEEEGGPIECKDIADGDCD